jgi:hypothetical protein
MQTPRAVENPHITFDFLLWFIYIMTPISSSLVLNSAVFRSRAFGR